MQFNFNDDLSIDAPETDVIAEQLSGLESEQFAILGNGEQNYVQVYLHDDGVYQLEYRQGSAEQHFEATGSIKLEDVQQAFLRFHSNASDWQTQWNWQPVSFEGDDLIDDE